MPTFATDLDYTVPREYGTPELEYPFESNGDLATVFITRKFKQYPANFKADQVAGTYRPGTQVDSEIADAWLMATSKATTTPNGLYAFTRTFARIPTDQVTKVRRPLVLPTVSDEGGTTWSVRSLPSLGVEIATGGRNNTGLFLSDNRVFGPFTTGAGILTLRNVDSTTGNFTISYKASTTGSLGPTNSNATIAAAINALAAVVSDGLTVSVACHFNDGGGFGEAYIVITITVGSTTSPFTLNAAGLTMTPVSSIKDVATTVTSSTSQTLEILRTCAVPAQTYNDDAAILMYTNSGTTAYAVEAGDWFNYSSTVLLFKRAFGSVTPLYLAPLLGTFNAGTTNPLHTKTERFYLPGVSPGIATVADIPDYDAALSDDAKIAAFLAAGNGLYVVDFEGPDKFRDWPLQRTATIEAAI